MSEWSEQGILRLVKAVFKLMIGSIKLAEVVIWIWFQIDLIGVKTFGENIEIGQNNCHQKMNRTHSLSMKQYRLYWNSQWFSTFNNSLSNKVNSIGVINTNRATLFELLFLNWPFSSRNKNADTCSLYSEFWLGLTLTTHY